MNNVLLQKWLNWLLVAIIANTSLILVQGCSNDNNLSSQHKQRILSVLEKDNQLDFDVDDPREVYRKMCNISLEGCPVDFCEAYSQHRLALSDAVDLFDELEQYIKDSNSDEALFRTMVESFVGGLCGNATYGYDKLVERNDNAAMYFDQSLAIILENVKETYFQCLRVADAYGVDVGKYY